MAQIFHPSMNTITKATIFGAIFFIAAAGWIGGEIVRSPYYTQVNVARAQPVPFSHEHHVAGLGIDCRYCHTSVEKSSFAGIPPTQVCMNCHKQVWADSPTLEPVRASLRDNRPIEWTRVNKVADFVYFDHSIHVHKGVGCETCHGRVDEMPFMYQVPSLLMEWCLDCHRQPERHLRPQEAIFDLKWRAPPDQLDVG